MAFIALLVLRLRVAALVLVCAALASCGGGGGGGGSVDPTARQSVGAAGGSISSPDGTLTLTIPAGALGQDTEITITEVSSVNVPNHLKPLEADRVFKLGPDGLQFAQPATAVIDLAAGNAIAVMLIDSGGTVEYATGQQVDVGAAGRKLSGGIAHFSHLVAKTVDGLTLEFTVDKRQLQVSQTLQGDATLAGTAASNAGGDAGCDIEPSQSTVLRRTSVWDSCSMLTFFPGTPAEASVGALWECLAPGNEVVRAEFFLNDFATLLPWRMESLDPLMDAFKITAAIDIVCTAGPGGPGIATGVTPLPFATGPDGLLIRRGAFAGQSGLLAFIATLQGMVVMDLLTDLSAINLTTGGPQGGLGTHLLGVQPIRAANGVSAVVGTSTSAGYLRNWLNGGWGFTQAGTYAYIDADNAGGRLDAEEMITVAPARGIEFVRYDGAAGFFTWIPGLSLSSSAFSGTLRSAALPSSRAGSPALVLSAGTDGGTTSSVWAHPRQAGQPAVRLFSFPGGDARRLRCSEEAASPSSQPICIVTEHGTAKVHLFRYDPANPLALPTVQELSVGAGPLGVQFGSRVDGKPVAVVSNFLRGSVNVIDFDANGDVTANTTVALPAGCTSSAHAAPFAEQGRDYIAGTCPDPRSYFKAARSF